MVCPITQRDNNKAEALNEVFIYASKIAILFSIMLFV